ncbi:MAG: helix-hairpin-helix domain-containing protein [Candidatus Humimicrobiaceae bacterium]
MHKISKLLCFIDRIKYERGKHLTLAVVVFTIAILVVLVVLFFKAKSEVKIKENILESYAKNSGESSPNNIKVYICGYVKKPGVYEVKEGSRIDEVLEAAGGPTEEACLQLVNLAKMVSDEQKIYIPSQDEAPRNEDSSMVNINYASRAELEKLPGIGPVTAQKIINYRENQLFEKKEDLKKVDGIGDKKYQSIKDLISI